MYNVYVGSLCPFLLLVERGQWGQLHKKILGPHPQSRNKHITTRAARKHLVKTDSAPGYVPIFCSSAPYKADYTISRRIATVL